MRERARERERERERESKVALLNFIVPLPNLSSTYVFPKKVSDRASQGVYEDLTGPAAKDYLEAHSTATNRFNIVATSIVPDDQETIQRAMSKTEIKLASRS